MSALSAALRRLQRRQTQAPALIEPAAQALDAALERARSRWPGARKLPARGRISIRASWSGSRRACSPARRQPQIFGRRGKSAATCRGLWGATWRSRRWGGQAARVDRRRRGGGGGLYRGRERILAGAPRPRPQALDRAVNAELAPLKLEGARFSTAIAAEPAGPDGVDQIEFWVQTNPGTRPGPLMKIASGGELARFMLALEGRARRQGIGADSRLRRNRYRRRRRGRRRDRAASGAACRRTCRCSPSPMRRRSRREPKIICASPRMPAGPGRVATRVLALAAGCAARGDRPHAGRARRSPTRRGPPPQG